MSLFIVWFQQIFPQIHMPQRSDGEVVEPLRSDVGDKEVARLLEALPSYEINVAITNV